MSPEDIDKLTIGEVRDIAARADEALRKFSEARALLGGPVGFAPAVADAPAAQPNRRPPSTKGVELTAEERAQRDVLMLAARGLTPEEERQLVGE